VNRCTLHDNIPELQTAQTRQHWLSTSSPEMRLDLTDQETDALARLLRDTIDPNHYPLSPRVPDEKAISASFEKRMGAPEILARSCSLTEW
jgi:hypothetical protein